MKRFPLTALLLLGACAVRQPVPATYRLMKREAGAALVPPGVVPDSLTERTFTSRIRSLNCNPQSNGVVDLKPHRHLLQLTVHRNQLERQPPLWLTEWSAALETSGCIPPGESWNLATEIVDAVPLDPRARFLLLHGDAVDLAPQVRIQVDSPILRDDSAGFLPEAAPASPSPGGLRLDLKSSSNLLGYERAWFAAQPKPSGHGLQLVPLGSERHIGSAIEKTSHPTKNYLSFAPDASFFRLIHKQAQTRFTALLMAGRTPEDLNTRAKSLENEGACRPADAGFCVAIPFGVAINLLIPVTVNGVEQLLHFGATVGELLRTNRREALPALSISKLHNGKLVPIEFDHTSTAILSLPLAGGETISWPVKPQP